MDLAVGFRQFWISFVLVLSGLAAAAPCARAQGVEVSVPVLVQQKSSATAGRRKGSLLSTEVVVWLTPVSPETVHPADNAHPGPFRLIQKDKQFTPRLLVVPTGSSVEFPNRDPFFHNVFSLFNGKRFDLGLYESGTSRSVRFDREGVSYIFCNIHPEMGAVVVALSTPYYGVSNVDGTVSIHNVPTGRYQLHVWSETAQPIDPVAAQRIVQVAALPVHVEEIILEDTTDPMKHHKNKFGDDYQPGHELPY